jgi:hypothetical protein
MQIFVAKLLGIDRKLSPPRCPRVPVFESRIAPNINSWEIIVPSFVLILIKDFFEFSGYAILALGLKKQLKR